MCRRKNQLEEGQSSGCGHSHPGRRTSTRAMRAPWQCLSNQSFSQGKGSADQPRKADCHLSRSGARAGGSLQDAQLRLLLQKEMPWQKQSKASPDRAALAPAMLQAQVSICRGQLQFFPVVLMALRLDSW